MAGLPEWMRPPREEGWLAEDLDQLPEAPRHTELIDGALVFMMAPQRRWHSRFLTRLTLALEEQAPGGVEVDREITVRLDAHNRPEPDIVVTTAPFVGEQTWLAPQEVLLVVETESPESRIRDRTVKPHKYAEAGIGHYWRVEEEGGKPVVHVYELDEQTKTYVPVGIFRDRLRRPAPFEVELDLAELV
ncbi:Uma2 family endonuclease [Actinosynnema sp. NPDC059797]